MDAVGAAGTKQAKDLVRLERWATAALVVHALDIAAFFVLNYGGVFRMPLPLYLLSSCVFVFDAAVLVVSFLWRAGCWLWGRTHSGGCRSGDKGRRRVAWALLLGTLLLFLQPAQYLFSEEIRQQPIYYYDKERWTPNVQIHWSPLLKVTSVVELADYREERYDCALPLLAKGLARWSRGDLPPTEWGFEESWGGPGYGQLVIREGSTVISIGISFQMEELSRVKAMTGLGQ